MTRPFKRVVAMADTHCGHTAGLTPPPWHNSAPLSERDLIQRAEMWQWYVDTLADLKPIDVLFFLGDAVDGKGERSGGTEQITTDRIVQAEMAAKCIEEVGAKETVMLYGTPYHTGVDEDWEQVVAKELGVEIHGWFSAEINGVKFDLLHKLGGSKIPYLRYTAVAREMALNVDWAKDLLRPLANFVLRAHVHYCRWAGEPGHEGIILPALQGYGSKYGIRQCGGRIDIGLCYFDISKEERTWHLKRFAADILKIESTKLG